MGREQSSFFLQRDRILSAQLLTMQSETEQERARTVVATSLVHEAKSELQRLQGDGKTDDDCLDIAGDEMKAIKDAADVLNNNALQLGNGEDCEPDSALDDEIEKARKAKDDAQTDKDNADESYTWQFKISQIPGEDKPT